MTNQLPPDAPRPVGPAAPPPYLPQGPKPSGPPPGWGQAPSTPQPWTPGPAAPPPGWTGTPATQPGWNAAPAAPIIVVHNAGGPGIFVRAVWFLFIGWWLSLVAIGVAYFACVTLIGLPLGFYIFNRLPAILTLRARNDRLVTEVRDGATFLRHETVQQLPMWIRALWFILVGWWLGAIYLGIAWGLCVIIITLPIGLVMFNRVGAVMTLLRY